MGSPFFGFKLEFKRNYDVDQTARRNTVLELGEVDDGVVVDVIGNGRSSEDTTACDTLEEEALRVDAPRANKAPRDPAVRYRIGKCMTLTRR